ncbi:MAG: peroxiredoxin [Oligoflexia bacterium]|nr:peroxiredoxin [Oligoflexia bacterium]MBF0364724.1 peroxiredoxin [Oligoflexia bacterium]
MKKKMLLAATLLCSLAAGSLLAGELKVGDAAPLFESKDQDGKSFNLKAQNGRWTVLYFYPKAETPGCTKQACAFRDSMTKMQEEKIDVFGISSDSVEEVKKFQEKHHLNFKLLADPDRKIISLYGTQMPIIHYAKRWTFIIDPELKIQFIDKDVNAEKDSTNVLKKILELKAIK